MTHASCRATVVIPTFNGGALLSEVVQAVLAQQTPWPFELLVIDSSSTDGSLRCLERTAARQLRIPPDAFNHGETRNLGARAALGEFVVFLVQDATPVGLHWLEALIGGMERHPDAVGGYARQRARAEADPALTRRIDLWTPPGREPVRRKLPSIEAYRSLTPAERIRMAAFDNVCSIIRRAWLLEHPFPPAVFGEDLCWSQTQLLAGQTLLYLPIAEVLHSHRRSPWAHLKRTRLEHTMLIDTFGLTAVPDAATLLRQVAGVVAGVVPGVDPEAGAGDWRRRLEGAGRQVGELIGQYLAFRALRSTRPAWRAGPF